MPWNGSGQFTRNFSWTNDAANSIPITASRMDSDTNDIVSNGFGNTLTRDGQGSATANLPMNGFKHTNCANGSAATDYATMGQIAGFAPLASPAFTGTPTAPTASAGTNSTQLATTAFVATALGSYLPLSGGTITGATTFSVGALGTSAGAALNTTVQSVTDANTDSIFTRAFRVSNGTSWTSAQWRIFRQVDASPMGFISFGDGAGDTSVALGSGSTTWLNVSGSGATTFSGNATFNGSASISGTNTFSYGGNVQPHIFVQSGTPTATAVGDLWFF